MNSNKLIYGGVAVAIIFLLALYFSTDDIGEGDRKVQQRGTVGIPKVIKSLEGDTTADSYASLQATVQAGIEKTADTVRENETLKRQLKQLKVEQEQFAKRLEFLDGQGAKREGKQDLGSVVVKELEQPAINSDKQKLIDKTNEYIPKSINTAPRKDGSDFHFSDKINLGDGLGLSNFSTKTSPPNATRQYNKNDPNAGWVMPVETKPMLKGQVSNARGEQSNGKPDEEKISISPAMTISDNSVLYDTKALTYLVGRIPVGGRVNDPYPVKFIVGSEILIANGHNLPGVEGMFFSGYATGDMNLNCVRADMNSYTFVFDDGRQVTFREKPNAKGGKEPMAYISDRFGLPCVVGDFVSNVGEFLALQTSLSALSVAGEAYAAAQTTVGTTSLGGGTSTVTGDTGKYVLGNVASTATEDVRKWFLDRQTNSFDAVVVKSGTEVSLHLNRDISLDYDEAARKVDYHFRVADSDKLD